jgi:nitrate/nitrite transporter NarK
MPKSLGATGGVLQPVSTLSVLAPFAAGFFLSNYYRSINAVLSPRLIADFQLTAGDLGLLTSIYFFTSAIFQAPLGMLMDRYGPRRVQAALLAVGGIGVLIFALGQDRLIVMLGRAIMGVGAAGALMTSFQAIGMWFQVERRPLFNGCVLAVGGLGGLAATLPTELILHVTDWRSLMIGVAAASFAASLFVFAVAPEKDERAARDSGLRAQLQGMATVYRDPLFWHIAPLYAATLGGALAFQGLWAGPWLKDVAELTTGEIAGDLLVTALLQTVSYVAVGYLATILTRHGITLTQIVAVGSALSILSQTALVLPSGGGRWLVLVGIGVLANINILLYPVVAARFPPGLAGRANTALNLCVFVGAFAVQYAVGLLIDWFPATASGRYPTSAYQTAFGVMIAVQVAAWVWYLIPTTPPGRGRRV